MPAYLLHGSWHQYIAVLIQEALPLIWLCPWEPIDGAILQQVVLQGLWIYPILVINAAIPLSHPHTRGSSSGQVAASVEAHISKTLTKQNIIILKLSSTSALLPQTNLYC